VPAVLSFCVSQIPNDGLPIEGAAHDPAFILEQHEGYETKVGEGNAPCQAVSARESPLRVPCCEMPSSCFLMKQPQRWIRNQSVLFRMRWRFS